MCILKDVIQHWTTEEIYVFMDYLIESKKFKYILLVNCCNQKNNDQSCKTGEWRQLTCNLLPLKKQLLLVQLLDHTKHSRTSDVF